MPPPPITEHGEHGPKIVRETTSPTTSGTRGSIKTAPKNPHGEESSYQRHDRDSGRFTKSPPHAGSIEVTGSFRTTRAPRVAGNHIAPRQPRPAAPQRPDIGMHFPANYRHDPLEFLVRTALASKQPSIQAAAPHQALLMLGDITTRADIAAADFSTRSPRTSHDAPRAERITTTSRAPRVAPHPADIALVLPAPTAQRDVTNSPRDDLGGSDDTRDTAIFDARDSVTTATTGDAPAPRADATDNTPIFVPTPGPAPLAMATFLNNSQITLRNTRTNTIDPLRAHGLPMDIDSRPASRPNTAPEHGQHTNGSATAPAPTSSEQPRPTAPISRRDVVMTPAQAHATPHTPAPEQSIIIAPPATFARRDATGSTRLALPPLPGRPDHPAQLPDDAVQPHASTEPDAHHSQHTTDRAAAQGNAAHAKQQQSHYGRADADAPHSKRHDDGEQRDGQNKQDQREQEHQQDADHNDQPHA